MRSNEERAGLIHKRSAEIKRERQKKKQRALDMICITACLILVVGVGASVPDWAMSAPTVHHASGAASLVASHAALGYILMGLMAFLLGVCVTVLLHRLHRINKRKQRENSDNEL